MHLGFKFSLVIHWMVKVQTPGVDFQQVTRSPYQQSARLVVFNRRAVKVLVLSFCFSFSEEKR